MKKLTIIGAAAVTGLIGWAAFAGPGPDNDTLVINGVTIPTEAKTPAGHPLDMVYSGWRFRSDETQALEKDDFENPAILEAEYGMSIWNTAAGTSNKSCADCHGDASSMKGLKAHLPRWNAEIGKPEALEMVINDSIQKHQGADPWKWESREMVGMVSYIGMQSRGIPMSIQTDGPMAEWVEKGKELYYTRVGLLDLSCSNCHEDNWGNMIRADHLSQGNINGFPTYRFKWQGMGSLHRRFKGCMEQVRAEPYERGSDEFLALEVYLSWRGAGLGVETPSVRN